jgi:two-component system sensor histidine kinase KdpD
VVTASVTPDQVAVHVVDDGPGIASDDLPRIFDKFVKARGDSETDGGQGTGLGLAIAKGIMEAHGGSIAAESPVASGRGTRMTLSFARKEPA